MPNTPKRVKFVGGTTAENDGYTGPAGQVTIDLNRREIRLHDSKKKGGWRIPNLDQLKRLFVTRDSEFGGLSFADEQVGLLTRIGKGIYNVRKVLGLNGIEIENADGTGGDIAVNMPTTYRRSLVAIADANLANVTGNFVVTKGDDSNLPDVWKTTSDVFIQAFSYEDAPGTLLQIARSATTTDFKVYTRIRNAGVFTDWAIKPDPVEPDIPDEGLYALVFNGVDMIQRSWSAKQLSDMIRKVVESIQYISDANAAVAKSFNHIFTADGQGTQTTKVTSQVITFATNDRIEIVASATAAKLSTGDAQVATIEIERSDLSWDIVTNTLVSTLPNEEAKSIEVVYRFVKSSTGYQPVDENWVNTTANVAATLTGRYRVSVGAANAKGARISRWR